HVETQINDNKNSLFQSFDRPFLKGRASRRRRRSPPQRRNSLTDKLLFGGEIKEALPFCILPSRQNSIYFIKTLAKSAILLYNNKDNTFLEAKHEPQIRA
ncbi:MAG: hypothetical protein IKJ91_03795, partial [Clostridia bacterium]|nr:hypothetical protein [Clostridia bacterium]